MRPSRSYNRGQVKSNAPTTGMKNRYLNREAEHVSMQAIVKINKWLYIGVNQIASGLPSASLVCINSEYFFISPSESANRCID